MQSSIWAWVTGVSLRYSVKLGKRASGRRPKSNTTSTKVSLCECFSNICLSSIGKISNNFWRSSVILMRSLVTFLAMESKF
ncbi:hypothetical protein RintRC_4583 [Richelia intracellularis]|nr:hypothetical protein RintRC_4583 [Richelia intracellularis]